MTLISLEIDKAIVEAIIALIFGTIGGGIYSFYQKRKNAQIDDEIEAKRKLKKYSKSLWMDLHEIHFRLKNIQFYIENNHNDDIKPLTYYPDISNDIDWYTKDGYYITSTAYLFSSLSSWISIYQRDITFLDFGDKTVSANFFRKIEGLKQSISDTSKGSIMWYYYFNGIGEKIITENGNSPITFAQFVNLLDSNSKFKLFYSQTFYFLNSLTNKEAVKLIGLIIDRIEDCKSYLETQIDIPKI